MESEWRMNVAREGWVGTGIELLTRVYNIFPYHWLAKVNIDGFDFGSAFVKVILPDGRQQFGDGIGVGIIGGFPWGYDTDPDHP